MATVAELLVRIGGDSSGLRREINNSQRQLRRAFGPEALEFSEGAAGLLGALAVGMGAVGVASVKMAADFAANKKAFTTLLGSADKAQTLLSDLATFASDTPFELPGLVNASKKLLAFQFDAQDIIPIMSAVGDAVSLVGGGQEAIDGVVRALGQMQAKGKLSAEEMNQLSERGINGWKYIADEMGISTAEVMKLSEQGAIDSTTAINAVVKGMQTNFAGGMAGMAKTVPGLLSTIKDNVGAVMRELGDKITVGLDLQNVLQKAADYLGTFASAVQSSGVKDAILGLIPPEATAAVFALGGALIAVAIPAMYTFGLSVWAAMAPMVPYIALGVAIGLLAYEIWRNWEPLSNLFSTLWDVITSVTSEAWNAITSTINDNIGWAISAIGGAWNSIGELTSSIWGSVTGLIDDAWQGIKNIVASGVNWIVSKMQPLLDLVGAAIPSGLTNFFNSASAGLDKVKTAASGINLGFTAKDISGLIPSAPTKPNTVFTGLHGASASAPAGASGGSGGGNAADQAAKKAEKAWEQLEKKAEQVTKSIEQEWVQTTKTQLEQLEIWKEKQIDDLNVVKAEYEASGQEFVAYEDDKAKAMAVYSFRRTKIVQQEAKDAIDSFKSIRDGYMSIQKELTLGGLTGSAKDKASNGFDLVDREKGVTDYFEKINNEYETGNERQRQNVLDNLTKMGIDYQKADNDRLNFSIATEKIIGEYRSQANLQDAIDYANCKDVKSDIDAAYQANSMSKLKEALTAENAERLNNYNAQKSMMDTYQQAYLQAHSTMAQLTANLYNTALNGLGTAFSDILMDVNNIGSAFDKLGQTMCKVVTDFVGQWLAGRLMMALFGDQSGGKQTAQSVTQGAATAAAWWPAAIAVSLATFGANSGPAIGGMAAASIAGMAMGAISGKATGGAINGPGTGTSDSILTWLSNGEYVIKASAVRTLGLDALDTLNTGKMPAYATGGLVTGRSLSSVSASKYANASMDGIKSISDKNKSTTDQRAGDQYHFTISGNDGPSIRKMIMSEGATIIKSLKNQAKGFNTAGVTG